MTNKDRLCDDTGRDVAPAPTADAAYVRPLGPWDANTSEVVEPVLLVICAWCPDFDPKDPRNANASHGICPTCAARVHAAWDDGSHRSYKDGGK